MATAIEMSDLTATSCVATAAAAHASAAHASAAHASAAHASASDDPGLLREEVLDRLYSLARTMQRLQKNTHAPASPHPHVSTSSVNYKQLFDALKLNFTMEKAVTLVMLMDRDCTEHGEQQKFNAAFQSVRTYGADIMQMYLNVV